MLEVTEGTRNDIASCLSIAKSLPVYFTSRALEAIEHDLGGNPFYVARNESGQILGFASVKDNTEQAAELLWLAVAEGHRRRGTGTLLVNAVCATLKAKGLKVLLVRTLSESVSYAPYEASRQFFKMAGFVHIDTLDPCPGWDPGNPCDIYAKTL